MSKLTPGRLKRKWWMIVVAGVVLLPCLLLGALSVMSVQPKNLGVSNHRLSPCPNTPNCVCTFDTDQEHGIDSIPLTLSKAAALEQLTLIINQQPRTKVVETNANYLHAESTSLLFRFVDDIEFLIDESTQQIHFRSASRTGRSDLGVNRKRMEAIRKQYLSMAIPDKN